MRRADGVVLESLAVEATSRSDTRGVLRMTEPDGTPVSAGAHDLKLQVRIRAAGIDPHTLRRMVEQGLRASPIAVTVTGGAPLALHVDIEAG